MAYDLSAKFIVFDDLTQCEQSPLNEPTLNFDLYTAATIATMRAAAGAYALVAKGERRLTPCIAGLAANGQIVFPMSSNVVQGKRQVVVIENSQMLSEAGGGAIKRGVMLWLKDLKESGKTLPVSLFVVKGGNEVQEFLRGEDIARLPFESGDENTPSIVGKISEYVNFIGQGFQPLKNIAHIGQKTAQAGVERILYFTDSYGMPEVIDDSLIGTLLGWKIDGVAVMIVTNGDCAKWAFKNLVSCEQLAGDLKEVQIKELLLQWQTQ